MSKKEKVAKEKKPMDAKVVSAIISSISASTIFFIANSPYIHAR